MISIPSFSKIIKRFVNKTKQNNLKTSLKKKLTQVDLVAEVVNGLFGPNHKIYFEQFKEAFLEAITLDKNINDKIGSSLSETMSVKQNIFLLFLFLFVFWFCIFLIYFLDKRKFEKN